MKSRLGADECRERARARRKYYRQGASRSCELNDYMGSRTLIQKIEGPMGVIERQSDYWAYLYSSCPGPSASVDVATTSSLNTRTPLDIVIRTRKRSLDRCARIPKRRKQLRNRSPHPHAIEEQRHNNQRPIDHRNARLLPPLELHIPIEIQRHDAGHTKREPRDEERRGDGQNRVEHGNSVG
jgi:hypothetical protein